ncbi:MAG TPA: imidazole glycerol phosphate synthase subunit HisH [Verrucomicrobiales bacterium]|nr:imidazole glycerol phosphate synthase subunit HisH [Verrucomicrobiales bacterium]
MIAVIDYDSGNLRSVHKALLAVGADARVIRHPEGMRDARAVVLPGVGAFDDCINALRRQELLAAVKEFIGSGRPFLGICVGYQALFEASEEYNSCAQGLGLFRGRVVRFNSAHGLKIPQIGWNQVRITKPDCPLYRDIADGTHFYFVHSFHPQPEDQDIVATRTDYGVDFSSSIWRENVYATQFHPEKSQTAGMQLLRNFVAVAG